MAMAPAPPQGCLLGVKPLIPLLGPLGFRHKNAIQERCDKTSSISYGNNLDVVPAFSISRSSNGSHQELRSVYCRGMLPSHIFAASSVFLSGGKGGLSNKLSMLLNNRRSSKRAQAQMNSSGSLSYPALTEKPEWWWRTLACAPYLISLQISDAGFFLQPFLEHHEFFEDLIYYIPGAAKRWSMWFPMLYYYFSYLGLVKNKDFPHFFRYHLMMAMLLETVLQLVWHSSNFMPLIHFNGTYGMYYWAAVGFIYIFTLLECIRCALCGKYVKIPLLSESALIHTKFFLGGFFKPF